MRYLVILLLLVFPFLVSAFGVSPPFINQSKLVPGSHYEQVIFLVRADASNDLGVNAVFDVPEEIKEWFSIDKGNEFIMPAGVQQYPITVIVDIPENTELGIYKGFLRINTVPPKREGGGSGVAIAVGVRVDINLTVGDEVISDFEIKKLDILDIEEGEPPQIIVTLENTGNVSVTPERATLELFDKYGEVRLGFAQTEKFPKTPSFKTNTFVVELPIDIKLGLGEYWANARIYKNGTIAAETKTVFNVIEKKANWLLYVLIAAGILILVSIPVFILRRKKKNKLNEFYQTNKTNWTEESNKIDRPKRKTKR